MRQDVGRARAFAGSKAVEERPGPMAPPFWLCRRNAPVAVSECCTQSPVPSAEGASTQNHGTFPRCVASTQELAAKVVGNLKLGESSTRHGQLDSSCLVMQAPPALLGLAASGRFKKAPARPETCLGLSTLARDIWKTGAWACT